MEGRCFCATPTDLLPGLDRYEARHASVYVRVGSHQTRQPEVYQSVHDIGDFGLEHHPAAGAARQFLVLLPDTPVVVEPVRMHDGTVRHFVELEANPDSFMFQPGGWYAGSKRPFGSWYEGEHLLAGAIYTAVPVRGSATGRRYLAFAREVLNGFARYRSWDGEPYWVGPGAEQSLQAGVRLVTHEVTSPDGGQDLHIEDIRQR